MSSKVYEMAVKLNAKMGNGYKNTFSNAEAVAKNAFSKIAKVGATILGGIGIADIANTYKEFQQSMANTGAIAGVDKTSDEYKALEEAAKAAGKATTKTATEAADALGYMKLAGWDSKDAISGLMPVLRLSEATGADLATTSDLVTDSMSAMGISVNDLSRYLDVAANANNKTNQTATQMLETFIGAGGMFKELGTSMEEAAALSGALANRGIKGSEGATSLNSILINLMGNSKSAHDALEALGVSAYDSNGKFKGVTKTLEEISKAMKGATDEKRGWFLSKLGGKTQIDTLNALLSGIETLGENGKSEIRNLTTEFEDSTGALEHMSEVMNDTFSSALSILGSASDDVKISIMEQIEPSITPIIRDIADVLPGIGVSIAKFVKTAVSDVKKLWKGVKPAFEFLKDNFGVIKSGIMGLAGALVSAKIVEKVSKIAKGISTAFKSISTSSVILMAIEAIVGLSVAFSQLYKEIRKIDLQRHFGKIVLSTKEVDSIVGKLVNSGKLEKMQKQLSKFENLDSVSEEMQKTLEQLEKYDWEIEVGFKLTTDEQQGYKQNAKTLVSQYMQFFQDAFQADYSLFSGNQKMLDAIKEYYLGKNDDYYNLGQEYLKAVYDGFADGILTADEKKIIDNFKQQMENAKTELTKETFSESLINLGIKAKESADSNGGKLSKESYDEIMKEGNEQVSAVQENAREVYARRLAVLAKTKGRGTKEYEKQAKLYEDEYRRTVLEAKTSLAEFGFDMGILTPYGEDIQTADKNRSQAIKNVANSVSNAVGAMYGVPLQDWRTIYTEGDFKRDFSLESFGLSSATSDNLRELYGGVKSNERDLIEYLDLLNTSGDKSLETQEKIKKTQQILNNLQYAGSLIEPEKYKNSYYKAVDTKLGISSFGDRTDTIKTIPKLDLSDTTIVAGPDKLRKTIKRTIQQIMDPFFPVKANTEVNEGQTNLSSWKNNVSKLLLTNIFVTSNLVNTKVKAGKTDTSSWKNSVLQALATASLVANTVVNTNVKANTITSNTKEETKSKANPNVKKFATGTNYTPDTFIAGEKGPELITGARGRKVFTALETSKILNSSNSDGIVLNINNNIHIDGNANDDIEQVLNDALNQSSERIANNVLDIINQRNARKFRLSNS